LRARGIDVSAIAELSPSRREAAARLVPGARIYEGHAEMLALELELDAAIVATPPLHHAVAVRACLAAGLHVLCEKPLTLDAAAFQAIAADAETRDRAVFCVDNWAYSPQWTALLALAGAGALGKIRRAEIFVSRTKPSASALPGDWRKDPAVSGGGILVDHGWHNLYLLRRLLGPNLRLDSADLTPAGAVDEVADVVLTAPGAAGALHLSWRAPSRSNAALVRGDDGTAELRDDVLEIRTKLKNETLRFPSKLSEGSAHPDWLAAMWPAFEAECAGEGRGENLAEASFCLDVIRAAYAGREAARVG